ncbi:hypothetical protein [Streptomyces sp. NBC_01768]|uniref:hypothetical protein n=1 Tax=Streptomyces sp. NBC_01768 TaxID=2975938 RepID=UPI002DDB8131|nr:hypothetical protein [Streptomyces sp. NBC_01768]WSC31811.1 hypothetical protein OG902_36760 [Streptomyces sp. NBC_01768]
MNERTVEIQVGGLHLVGVRRSEYRRLVEGSSAHVERLKAQLEAAQKAHAEMTKDRDFSRGKWHEWRDKAIQTEHGCADIRRERDELRRELDELRSLRPAPGDPERPNRHSEKAWQTSTAEGARADESFTMRRLGTTSDGGPIFSIDADSSKSLRRILK